MTCDDNGSTGPAKPLLGDGEPSPVRVENPGAGAPFLFIGDHAGRAVPHALAGLGLPPAAFERHIACDHGVEEVGVGLAGRLGAMFIRQRYSRLVIDCNRAPGAADSIPAVSDGVTVPGNARLTGAERTARRRAIFDPYHARIAEELDAREARGLATVLVSLHSFTPVFAGLERPWRFGVLHRGDSPFSAAVLALLRDDPGTAVGDNRPYAMDADDHTVPAHRRNRAIDYLELEMRQDLIAAPNGQAEAVGRLARRLGQALAAVARAPSGPLTYK